MTLIAVQNVFHAASYLNACYDRAGFFVYRALTDESFLTPAISQTSPKIIKLGAACFEAAKAKFQNGVRQNMLAKGAHGNFSPKPLSKAFRFARQAAAVVAAAEWSGSAVLAAGVLTTCFTAYAFSHMGHTDVGIMHTTSDAMANWLGSNLPNRQKAADIPPPPMILP